MVSMTCPAANASRINREPCGALEPRAPNVFTRPPYNDGSTPKSSPLRIDTPTRRSRAHGHRESSMPGRRDRRLQSCRNGRDSPGGYDHSGESRRQAFATGIRLTIAARGARGWRPLRTGWKARRPDRQCARSTDSPRWCKKSGGWLPSAINRMDTRSSPDPASWSCKAIILGGRFIFSILKLRLASAEFGGVCLAGLRPRHSWP